MEFRILKKDEYHLMLPLLYLLNPQTKTEVIQERLAMLDQPNYECAAIVNNGSVIGICGIWFLVKIYSGLQAEIDNVVVDTSYREQNLGTKFMDWVTEYVKKRGCESIELNAYLTNSRSHKFYFNQGFKVLGFHMQKNI